MAADASDSVLTLFVKKLPFDDLCNGTKRAEYRKRSKYIERMLFKTKNSETDPAAPAYLPPDGDCTIDESLWQKRDRKHYDVVRFKNERRPGAPEARFQFLRVERLEALPKEVIDRYPDIVDASSSVHYYKIVLGDRLDQPALALEKKEEQVNNCKKFMNTTDTTIVQKSNVNGSEKDVTTVAAPLRKKQRLMTDFLKPPK